MIFNQDGSVNVLSIVVLSVLAVIIIALVITIIVLAKKNHNLKKQHSSFSNKEKAKVEAKEETITSKDNKVYHLSKREDGKWAVKFEKGEKAIKLFDTKEQAIEYTKTMAKNQDASVLVHNSKGKNKGRIQKSK